MGKGVEVVPGSKQSWFSMMMGVMLGAFFSSKSCKNEIRLLRCSGCKKVSFALVYSSSSIQSDPGRERSHLSPQIIKLSIRSSSYSSRIGKESEKSFSSSRVFSDLPLGFSLTNIGCSATGAHVVVLFFRLLLSPSWNSFSPISSSDRLVRLGRSLLAAGLGRSVCWIP